MGSPYPATAADRRDMSHPSPHRDRVPEWALWGGIFGGPLAWAVQTIVNYSFVAHNCFPQADPRPSPVFGGMWDVALAVSAVALLGTAGAGLLALRGWRATRGEMGGETAHLLHHAEGRSRFMAISGLLMSGMFAGAVVTSVLPLFWIGPCS